MPGITVRTGADNSALERGLSRAKGMIASFKKDARMSQVFESDNKVKRAITGFTSDLANITSFSGLATAGIVALGNTFKNTLSAGLLIGVGTGFVTMGQQGVDAIREVEKSTVELREEISGLANKDLPGLLESLKNFQTQAASNKVDGGFADFGQNLRDFFGGAALAIGSGDASKFFAGRDARLAKQQELYRGIEAAASEAVGRMEMLADMETLRAEGANETADAMERQLKNAQELAKVAPLGTDAVAATLRKQQAVEQGIANKAQTKQNETALEQQRKADASKAARVDARTDELLKPQAQRIQEREAEQARARAQRRAINEQVEKEDRERRERRKQGGSGAGMTPEERETARARIKNQIANARSPEQRELSEIKVLLRKTASKLRVI